MRFPWSPGFLIWTHVRCMDASSNRAKTTGSVRPLRVISGKVFGDGPVVWRFMMRNYRRILVSLLLMLTLGFLMGQDGFCLFLGDDFGGGGIFVG